MAAKLVDAVGFNLEEFKAPPSYRRPNFLWLFVKDLALVLIFSLVVFLSVNAPAYYLISRYRLAPPTATEKVEPSPPAVQTLPPQYEDNILSIDKISVKAPVNWEVKSEEINMRLENGVVHLAGTGRPGEGKNIFITGHSSNYWWKAGSFNTVFALLPELSEGDEIVLTYQGKLYSYQVEKILEVKKSELEQFVSADKEQLTLMTCVPVGTNLRRLLVIAKPTPKVESP